MAAGGDREPERRHLTDAELQARRRNAQKSTGARTVEGKARVRYNALIHGGYAKTLGVITHGPLAEDATEIAAKQASIIADLDPQHAVEEHVATEIARSFNQLDRVHRYEASVLRAPSRVPSWPESSHIEDLTASWCLALAVIKDPTDPTIDDNGYQSAVSLLYCHGQPDDELDVPGWNPDEGICPDTPEGWQSVIEWLINRGPGNHAAALDLAYQVLAGTTEELRRQQGEHAREQVQRRVDDGTLAKMVDIRSRVRRDAIRMMDAYARIRQQSQDAKQSGDIPQDFPVRVDPRDVPPPIDDV
jgi:hypothetical protein